MKKISILLISFLIINAAQSQPWVQQISAVTSSLNSIFFTDASNGYAVGDGGKILKTTNGGTNWNSQTSGTLSQLNSVFFTSPTTGYVVGASGLIRKSTTSGTSWTAQTSNTTSYLYGVYFTDINNGYAVGFSGTILKTTNGGTNWTSKTSNTTDALYSVYFTSTSTGYAVGGATSSLILKTIDGGTTWTPQSCAAASILKSVYFTGVDTGYVAGDAGVIYKTLDGGTNWVLQPSSTTLAIHSIFFPNDNTGYAMCNAGYVGKTSNASTTWAVSATITANVLMSVFFTSVNTGYACGSSGTIIKTTTGGEPCTIVANAGVDQTVCSGQSATLTATGGSTYSWNTGANTASITVTPSSTTTYTVTATSTNGCTASDKVIVNFTTGGPASISIADSPTGSICSGTSITFTATPTNGGVATYQWRLNGTDITGATNSTYITSSLVSTDAIICRMTSGLSCATGSPATSNSITKTVYPSVPVSISIAASPNGGVCPGTSVTFTASPSNGGGTPAYQWKKNVTNIAGATTTAYTSSTLVTGDTITCTLTSSVSCPSGNPATSNSIAMTVSSALAASIIITASPGLTICPGTSVTFTATSTNGGTPGYQWKKNGTTIAGATNSTYTSTALANNDNITCDMTSSLSCATGSPATSNTLTMIVNSSLPVSVIIAASPAATVCSGTSVTLTATPSNGGSTPTYQWKNNGTNISGETNFAFTSSTLANSDAITCMLTSSSTCATGSPATSNTVTMTVNPNLPASLNIAANPSGAVCSGNSVTFTATPTNGGGAPTYQWQVNGTDISGETNSTYISSSLANADAITCVMTSALSCVTSSPAISNSLAMTVNTTTANAGTDQTICLGQSATLTASGGTSFQWNNGLTTSSINVSPSITTTYIVTITNNGCSATDDILVTVNTVIADAGADQTVCPGQVATLTASGGGTYLWSTNETTQSISVIPVSSNYYTVTVSNNGCNALDSVLVNVDNPSADAGADVVVCAGDSVILSATGGISYIWNNGIENNIPFIPTGTTIYTVTSTDINGCTATDNVLITVNPIPPTPVISLSGNILTSNADSLNQWYLNDTLIAGATDTSYTVSTNGSYYVIVSLNGCDSDTSNIISTTLGFNETALQNDFIIYPNPATNIIHIENLLKSGSIVTIEILNIEGQIINRIIANEKQLSIDISGIARGMYFVKVKTENGMTMKKFVKE